MLKSAYAGLKRAAGMVLCGLTLSAILSVALAALIVLASVGIRGSSAHELFVRVTADRRLACACMNTALFVAAGLAVQAALMVFVFVKVPYLRPVDKVLGILPALIPTVAVATLGTIVLSPALNPLRGVLERFGIAFPSLLSSPWSARMAIVAVDTFQWAPALTVLLIWRGENLPRAWVEQAELEGLTRSEIRRRVELGAIRPTLCTLLTLRALDLAGMYDIPYNMLGPLGGVQGACDTIAMYIHRLVFRHGDDAYGATLGVAWIVLSALILVPVVYWVQAVVERRSACLSR